MEPEALDVWLKFTDWDEELATYEANTFWRADENSFVVEWYHNFVGQVSYKWFDTYAEARAWLEAEDFQDFSS